MKIEAVISNQYKDVKDKITANEERAKGATLDKIIKDTEPYVPYKTGQLTESVVKDVPSSSVSYTAPYASYAFNPVAPSGKAKKYDQSVHIHAQGYPVEAAYAEHGEEWARFYAEELIKDVK